MDVLRISKYKIKLWVKEHTFWIRHPIKYRKNKNFLKKYPFWEIRSWDGSIAKPRYLYSEYECIPEGWKKAFGEILSEDLREALVATDYLDKLYFVQVKSKYGSLRMYHNGTPDEVQNVLDAYELISNNVCMYCGKVDTYCIDIGGWIDPICEDCYNKKINCNRTYKECIGDQTDKDRFMQTELRYRTTKGEKKKSIKKYVEKVRKAAKENGLS